LSKKLGRGEGEGKKSKSKVKNAEEKILMKDTHGMDRRKWM
jgi:hypothetical protein